MSKILVRVKGNLNIVDTLNPDGPVVTLSVETFEQLAAAYGYSKADPDKVSVSVDTAEKLFVFTRIRRMDLNGPRDEIAFKELQSVLVGRNDEGDLTFALNPELEVLSESTAP